MKKILQIQLIVTMAFAIHKGYAQEDGCLHNTNTNWNPIYMSPNSANDPNFSLYPFKGNTFDWTSQSWFSWMNLLSGFSPSYVNSPFYSNSYPFSYYGSSDFRPEDGWELVKQDMGYFYDNGAWDGAGEYNSDGSVMGHNPNFYPGDPREVKSKINYFLLYNKYNTTLRVLAYIENGLGSGAYNTIVVSLHLLNNANYNYAPTSLPNYGFPYTQNYMPNTNGIFNVYNPESIFQSLDKNTNVTDIMAPAIFPYGSTGDMFYADFQLAYDPCVCFFQSGIGVDFHSQMQATVVMNGKFAGITSNINVAQALTSNPNDGSIYGQNNTTGENFISSMFANGNSPEALLQSYKDMQSLKNDGDNTGTIVKDAIDLLTTGISVYTGIGLAAGPAINILGHEIERKDALEGGSKVLEYLSGRINSDDNITPPEPNLAVSSGYLELNGTIAFDSTNYNQIDFAIGTPGSKDADILPEYSKHVGAVSLPNYPMYNEPTGLFTLLNTPIVNCFNSVVSTTDVPSGTSVTYHRDYLWTASIPSNFSLLYKFNPLVDISKSKVYVGLEFKGVPSEFAGTPKVPSIPTELGNILDCLNKQININAPRHKIDAYYEPPSESFDNTTNFTSEEQDFSRNYMTPFYPMSCLNNLISKIQRKISITYIENTDGYFLSFQNDCFKLPNGIDLVNPKEVRLVVLLDLTSKSDAYHKVHKMFQIQKYKCDINSVATDPLVSTPLNSYLQSFQNAANNLNQVAHSFNQNIPLQEVYSFGTINITGNQDLPLSSGHKVNLIAEKEIDVTTEVTLTSAADDFVLKIQSEPTTSGCENTPLTQLDYEAVAGWCNNNSFYKANQLTQQARGRLIAQNEQKDQKASNSSAVSPIGSQLFGTDYKIGIFPNPTNSNITVSFLSANSNSVKISVEDLAGKEVINQSYTVEQGYNQNKLNLNNLENGVYLIKVSDIKSNLIKTEKIILNK